MHNLQISTYKNNSHSTRTTLKCRRSLQPYFKSRKGINQTSLCHVQPTRFAVNFFSHDSFNTRKPKNYYKRATYRSAVSTRLPTLQHQLENKVTSLQELHPTRGFLQTHLQEPKKIWFTSNGFLKRPVSLKYWLLRPFSMR